MNPLISENFAQYNELKVLSKIDDLKAEIESLRPLSSDIENRIMQKFRLDWNYNSNAIEGNSLDYGETAAFLMHGVTAKGKPLKDYLDIKGHNEAIDHLIYLTKNGDKISEADIRNLHKMLLVEPYENPAQNEQGVVVSRKIHIGEYKRMPNHVKTVTGETHYYATPEDTPLLMHELIEWFREAIELNVLHPVIIAAVFHHRFTEIHPFDDGNGRMSRLLMNLILIRFHFPPVVIKAVEKNSYYLALSQADTGDFAAFIEFIAKNTTNSLDLYLKGAQGENIDEPTDLKKKLLLFKKEIEGNEDKVEVRRSPEILEQLYNESLKGLIESVEILLNDFKEFFFSYDESVIGFDGSKFVYQPVDISYVFANLFLEQHDYKTVKLLNFRLSNFKVKDNSFSIDVIVYVSLGELTYSVSSLILEGGLLSNAKEPFYNQWLRAGVRIENKYHQQLSSIDSDSVLTYIGETTYSLMNNLFQNRFKNIQSLKEEVIETWKEVILKTVFLSDEMEASLTSEEITFTITSELITVGIPFHTYDTISMSQKGIIESYFYRNLKKLPLKISPFIVLESLPPF